ncbi:MAG: hypothetical protein IT464_11975 [Planctomycetes bacterium]|nr:hypothetical protein [Planctomycetota bacterium]
MLIANGGAAFIFIIFIVGIVIAAIVWGAKHQKMVRENWATFAQRNNLQYMGTTYGGMSGWFGRTQIRINTITRGSGKNRSTYTQYHATVSSPMPSGLVLYKEGFFSKVGKMLGGEDVQIGDPAIDAAFIIKAGDLLGAHKLLSIPPVKQALLAIVGRHPGLRLDGRTLFWEESGVTHKYESLEANARDLAYLCETFDAAFHQLAGTQAAPPAPRPAPRASDAANILFDAPVAAAMPSTRLPEPVIRRAAPDEDPAERKHAMEDVASAFQQLEKKIETGRWTPEYKAPEPVNLEDAFASPHLISDVEMSPFEKYSAANISSAFADSKSNAFNANAYAAPAKSDAFNANAYTAPATSDAFDAAKPFEAATPTAPPEAVGEGSFDELVESLSAGNLMSSDRDKLVQANASRVWPVKIKIDRVDSTFGFDIPDSLRDGKTVEGELPGGTKVTVRFPKSRNAELEKMQSGNQVSAIASIAGWDDLFKKLTLNG